jgi:ABC-type Zn uptake system ZnuABC Zn-binding protein ZnuA
MFRWTALFGVCLSIAALLVQCKPSATRNAGAVVYCVTIQPLRAILAELVKGRAEVVCLLPPGVSPHTYEIRPSDASAAENARVLFYVDDSLDGWAAKLSAKKRISVFGMVPESMRHEYELGEHAEDEHVHSGMDAHFWTDPVTVSAVVDTLAGELSSADSDGSSAYAANAARFKTELAALDVELKTMLAPYVGRSVVLFHPSFGYLLHRYGISVAAVVEPSPGKEASPQFLNEVIEAVKKSGVHAVFSEPQLPKRPAEIVAESAGVKVLVLDPNGGSEGRGTYADLMRYNARTIVEALK